MLASTDDFIDGGNATGNWRAEAHRSLSSTLQTAVAEPALALKHGTETKKGGLVQPSIDQLDADRKLLAAETITH